jgi:hypothetical protein
MNLYKKFNRKGDQEGKLSFSVGVFAGAGDRPVYDAL